jgi:hypothetical protein
MWWGYLPCYAADRPKLLQVIGIAPSVWDACAEASNPAQDLRRARVALSRAPGSGRPSLTLEVLPRGNDLEGRPVRIPTLKEIMLAVWSLPATCPDYRLDVYAHLVFRTVPEDSAPVFRSLEEML